MLARKCYVCRKPTSAQWMPYCDLCRARFRKRTPPQPRLSRQARGYGAEHDRLRAQWKPRVEAGGVGCARCGLEIPPAGRGPCPRCGKNHGNWDLGHVDGTNKQVYSGPEHMCCNRRTATHAAQRRRATR